MVKSSLSPIVSECYRLGLDSIWREKVTTVVAGRRCFEPAEITYLYAAKRASYSFDAEVATYWVTSDSKIFEIEAKPAKEAA
jgi:hypothetical protein